MKRTTLSLLLIFSMIFCLAQTSQMSLSEKFDIKDAGYSHQYLSHAVHIGDNFYTVTNKAVLSFKGIFNHLSDLKLEAKLTKYDKDMNVIKEADLENGEKNFGPIMPELVYINNTLLIGYYKPIDKSSFSFYLARVNDDLSLGDSLKICSIDQKNLGLFKMNEALDANFITITNSPDSQKMFLVARTAAKQLEAFIIGNDLKLLSKRTVKVDMQIPEVDACYLTASGVQIFLLSENDVFQVVTLKPDGVKNEFKVTTENGYTPIHCNITPSRDGHSFYIYSTTALTGTETKAATGITLTSLDCNTLQIGKSVHYLFTPQLCDRLCEQGAGRKYKKDIYLENFIPDLMEMENGDLVVFSSTEQFKQETAIGGTNNGIAYTESVMVYYAGPIMAFYLHPKDATVEVVSIPRNLVVFSLPRLGEAAIHVKPLPGPIRSYLSFFVANKGDRFVIVYVDDVKNLEQGLDNKPKKAVDITKFKLVEALVNPNRKIEYRKTFETPGDNNYGFLPASHIPSATTIVFAVADQGKIKFGFKNKITNWCFLKM